MYEVVVTNYFEKKFKKLKNPQLSSELKKVLGILELDPLNITKKYNIKKLTNLTPGNYRIRVGDYRIRYDVLKKEVVLHTIGHRKDVYK